jgi:AraC-like DNA-binding protein
MASPAPAVLDETDMVSAYREWAEPGDSQVVQCWWEQRIAARTAVCFQQRVLPDGYSDVIVSADGNVLVVGPTMDVSLPQLPPATHLRGLRLKTEALASVLGCPGALLRDANLPLSAVVPNGFARELAQSIWDGILPDRLRQIQVDGRVRHAVHRLRVSHSTEVATVAGEVGLSERHLRRLLIDQTGIGPRSLQRVGRLQRFLELADTQWPTVTLARLAATAGYSDQAHLSRDVRELAGVTPTSLLRERSSTAMT